MARKRNMTYGICRGGETEELKGRGRVSSTWYLACEGRQKTARAYVTAVLTCML